MYVCLYVMLAMRLGASSEGERGRERGSGRVIFFFFTMLTSLVGRSIGSWLLLRRSMGLGFGSPGRESSIRSSSRTMRCELFGMVLRLLSIS
jgi:hypothetical protein